MKTPRIILTLLICCITLSLSAQKPIYLWGNERTHHKQKTKLFFYPADKAVNTHTAVIICPGGSYCWLGMKTEGKKVAQWLQERGINAYVLHYRVNALFIRHPAMMEDVQKAIVYVRKHAEESDYDTRKVGIMGFSAGGHLAGMANAFAQKDFIDRQGSDRSISLLPDFVAMIYPVVSMQDSITHQRSRQNSIGHHPAKKLIDSLSLELNIHKGMAPVFLMNCRNDKTVKDANSVVFDKALSSGGVPHVYCHFDKGGHGFGMYPKQKDSQAKDWGERFLQWLKSIRIL